jgi:DNA-binding response OmpR family regulator
MPAKILIVDDDASLRGLVRAILANDGYALEDAGGVAAAWTAIEQAPPALVILDYKLPDGDGFALLRKIRAHPRHFALPVVMLTGAEKVSSAMEGISAGASDYLVKPFEAKHLQERVRFQLARGAHTDDSVIFPGS